MAKAVDDGEGGSLVGLRELGSTLPQYRRACSGGLEESISHWGKANVVSYSVIQKMLMPSPGK